MFKENEQAINDIRKSCSNEEEFNNRIMNLATLINEMEVKKLVSKPCKEGTINFLEAFLEEKFPSFNKSIVKNLRQIITLRSKKHPIHKDDKEFIDAVQYFELEFPPDWQELWERALSGYLESLKGLLEIIQKL